MENGRLRKGGIQTDRNRLMEIERQCQGKRDRKTYKRKKKTDKETERRGQRLREKENKETETGKELEV